MTIHHATAKKAEKLGITLSMVNEADASHGYKATSKNVAIVEDDPKEALANAADAQIVAEQAGAFIARDVLEDDYVATKVGSPDSVLARDPDLQDLFETLEEAQPEEDEEDERSGSVVPDKYKKEYAMRNNGDPTHCGDWLAVTLNSILRVKGDKGRPTTDLDAFETLAIANGVDESLCVKLRSGTPGWQGRFRMTVRNRLTKLVAEKGELFIPEGTTSAFDADKTLKAPKQWCADNAPKPKAKKKAAVTKDAA